MQQRGHQTGKKQNKTFKNQEMERPGGKKLGGPQGEMGLERGFGHQSYGAFQARVRAQGLL